MKDIIIVVVTSDGIFENFCDEGYYCCSCDFRWHL